MSSWNELRERAIERDGGECQIKGPSCQTDRQLHVHHEKPRYEGGSDHLENLVTVCRNCHYDVCHPDFFEGKVPHRMAEETIFKEWLSDEICRNCGTSILAFRPMFRRFGERMCRECRGYSMWAEFDRQGSIKSRSNPTGSPMEYFKQEFLGGDIGFRGSKITFVYQVVRDYMETR